jgi:multidrug resistance efflux pump
MTNRWMKNPKYLLTAAVIVVAIAAVFLKYRAYVTNPWTRDGQVRANVIQVTSRVSGPIVGLPIRDNQLVRAGDVLFEIDPRTYEAALEQARAQLDATGDNYDALSEQVESAKAQVEISSHSITQADATIKELDADIERSKAELERQRELLPKRATSVRSVERAEASHAVAIEKRKAAVASRAQAEAALVQSKAQLAKARAGLGAAGNANPQLRSARAAVRQAELNLEFTKVQAPVDGYVTNLNLRLGSQAVANQPALALVDVNSYWVHGYFREDTVANMRPGDRAIVTLMTYPDAPLEGRVDSLAWGIAQKDGSSGSELLPNVNPTFPWIRLAQRVPVRIHLDKVPENVELRVGTTASVLVMTGTAGENAGGANVPPVPRAIQ